MDLKFYKCMHCGNIAIKPFDAGVPLVCCGEKMTELTANTTDAAVEKHVPVVRVDGSNVHVEVGSTLHPIRNSRLILLPRVWIRSTISKISSAGAKAKTKFALKAVEMVSNTV